MSDLSWKPVTKEQAQQYHVSRQVKRTLGAVVENAVLEGAGLELEVIATTDCVLFHYFYYSPWSESDGMFEDISITYIKSAGSLAEAQTIADDMLRYTTRLTDNDFRRAGFDRS